MQTQPPPSPRTEVRRKSDRADYDRATIEAIVDEALICTIAFQHGGSVHCLPTSCWRTGDHLYIHGANNSRMAQALLAGECSVCIAHLDGLVLARSAFSTSVNYRSALIYGQFVALEGMDAKRLSLQRFFAHYLPGRWEEVRQPDENELAATSVLALPLEQAVCKVRNGPPEDKADDEGLPVWAGVLPCLQGWGAAQPVASCADWPLPASLQAVAAQGERRS